MALLLFLVLSGIVQRLHVNHANGLFGIGYAVVVSGSMEPNIHVDDMIIYHDHKPEEYQTGDVIVYRRNAGTPEEMTDCINVLLSEKVKASAADVGSLSDEAFAELMRKKRKD